MERLPTRDEFAQQLNTKFSLPPPGVDLVLVEVSDLLTRPHQEQFSILFFAPIVEPFGQGLFELQHEQLGTLRLFLVPVSQDEKGVSYEAVFNTMVDGS